MENDSQGTRLAICPSCGESNEKKNHFCVHCGNPLQRKEIFPLKNRYILFVVISFIIIGAIGYFLTGGFESKLVGKVNGEGISRKEFSMRVERAKKFFEARQGKGLFEGETGKSNLGLLKANILDEMVMERLLLQEARKKGYASVPEQEIEGRIEAIKKGHGLSDAGLREIVGGNIEEFREELRREWMISQFIEKALLKDVTEKKEVFFQDWLSKTKAQARIENFETFEFLPPVQSVCCKGGGCGGGERARPLDGKIEKEAKAKALDYYEAKTKKRGATARATNFGCHIQVDILEEGKVVVSYTYDRGEIREI